MLSLGKVSFTLLFMVAQSCSGGEGGRKSETGGNREGGISEHKVTVCLVAIIYENISENHCVSNCSSTKTVSSSNLSQHVLTMIVGL